MPARGNLKHDVSILFSSCLVGVTIIFKRFVEYVLKRKKSSENIEGNNLAQLFHL